MEGYPHPSHVLRELMQPDNLYIKVKYFFNLHASVICLAVQYVCAYVYVCVCACVFMRLCVFMYIDTQPKASHIKRDSHPTGPTRREEGPGF